MNRTGLIIIGILALAVIIILVAVRIIEFALGAILLGVAAIILWGLYRWAKNKIED